MANRGDTITLYLDYTLEGVPLSEDIYEIELQLNKAGSKGALNLTKTGGRVIYDNNKEMYYVKLTQNETFALPQVVRYQLRVKEDEDIDTVGSEKIGAFNLGDVLSDEEL